ncbi:hypothetical protein [Krasilnikovia sp. MM14-A1004]|uniref:hypothetical protein n=1 Tax=Krasilnikovia sp. MM14-A1004 TaxID=3373541 RepID=UPI00399CFC37
MVAAVVPGLSEQDLVVIRDAVAAGRRPRVVFTEAAGQMAGQLGQVVRLTDPAESEDWLVVRFGRDELPFSPGDLQVAPKGAGRRAPAVAAPEPDPEPARPEPEFVIDKPVRPSPAPAVAAPAAPVVPAARKGPGKPARPKGPAGLTVTLAYADGEWTVAAQQGAKALARPYVVRPAEALRMVALVDVPGVREAVEQILAAERAQAEQQAQRLREQLAEVEARLAELRDAE